MPDLETADQALALLSVAIGMLMEDHADEAVSSLPGDSEKRLDRFRRLKQAGEDIGMLSDAGEVLIRRSRSIGG